MSNVNTNICPICGDDRFVFDSIKIAGGFAASKCKGYVEGGCDLYSFTIDENGKIKFMTGSSSTHKSYSDNNYYSYHFVYRPIYSGENVIRNNLCIDRRGCNPKEFNYIFESSPDYSEIKDFLKHIIQEIDKIDKNKDLE
jgi:hypothetical protein